jgi:hypothetical protein
MDLGAAENHVPQEFICEDDPKLKPLDPVAVAVIAQLTAENERLQRVVEPTVEDIGYRVLGELFAKHGGEYLFIAYWSPDDLVIEEGDDADDVEFIIDFGDSRLSIRPNMATYITDKSIECASDWTQVKAHIEWMEANSNIPEAHLKREDGNG